MWRDSKYHANFTALLIQIIRNITINYVRLVFQTYSLSIYQRRLLELDQSLLYLKEVIGWCVLSGSPIALYLVPDQGWSVEGRKQFQIQCQIEVVTSWANASLDQIKVGHRQLGRVVPEIQHRTDRSMSKWNHSEQKMEAQLKNESE